MPPPKFKPSPWRDRKPAPFPTAPPLTNPSIWAVPAPSGHISAPFEPEASHSLSAYLAQSSKKPSYTAPDPTTACTAPHCPYHAYIDAFRHFEATNESYETGYQRAVPPCIKALSERTKTNVLVGVLDDLLVNRGFREEMGRAVGQLLEYALGGDEREEVEEGEREEQGEGGRRGDKRIAGQVEHGEGLYYDIERRAGLGEAEKAGDDGDVEGG